DVVVQDVPPALTVLYYGTQFPYYGYNECKIEDTGKQGTRTPSFLKRPPRRRRGCHRPLCSRFCAPPATRCCRRRESSIASRSTSCPAAKSRSPPRRDLASRRPCPRPSSCRPSASVRCHTSPPGWSTVDPR